MNEMKVFTNEEFGEVRVEEIEGKPYFCGSDVARALGYSNAPDALRRHCRAIVKRDTPISGKMQEINFIPEGDLYRLIVHSKLPLAEKFERWVFDEVLPSIRQHGAYMTDDTVQRALEDPDFLIGLATRLKEEREKRKALEIDNQVKDQQIAELQPKASYYDLVLQCKGLLSMTEIAKDYGMSAKGMNKKLHELGVEFNQSGVWFLYAKYQDQGYTQTKTQNYSKPDGTQGARAHMYWTQKGRLFLYELLKQNGILPMIERQEIA